MKHYDVIVVGAGPSAIFLAYEMIQLDKTKKVLLVEQGKKVEDRNNFRSGKISSRRKIK